MATRMTSSRLIGRVAELVELEAALRDAAGGHPSLAFVAGESGVGKSRVVAEFERRTREVGARIEIGECVELGDEELPYAPIVSVLRSLAREGDSILDELPAGARAELATLLPELGAGTWPAGPEHLRANETTLGQPRLFEALLTLLEHLGREQPLALVLEDIHWADRSTRAFLVFLGRSLWTERVLVVATYRSDELHRRHPLRPLLAELERDPRARRIELTRLTREELAELLADILGGPPDTDLVERLYVRSEGNPLFTEELLAAGLDGRGGLPTTMRDALMVRIERLSEPAQEALRLLSAGRMLSHDVLAEASGLGGADLRAVLREAAESNVIVADTRGRYQFRHALLREVVHDDLLPGEHAELHLALARALEGQASETGEDAIITAGIAHHYLSAGCQREALVASVRAADAAERVHAHGEAGALLERALDLWLRVADAQAQVGCDRIELVRRASQALINDGAYGRAEALLRQAVGEVDERSEPRLAAGLLELLSRAQWSLGRAEDARAAIARAVALLPEDDRSRERAQILSRQAKIAMLQGRFSEVLPFAQAALEAATDAGANGPRADALNAMGLSLVLLGDVEEGSAHLREAIAISPVGFERTSAWANLADALHLVGRSHEALAAAERGLADTAGPSRGSDWLTLALGDIQWDLGDWASARRRLSPPDRRHVGVTFAYVEMIRAEIALADGEHDLARASLDRIADVVAGSREPQFIGLFGSLRGELEHRCGDLAAARAAIDDGLDAIEFCSEDLPRIARLSETGAWIEADAAQRARDLGDTPAVRAAISRAEGFVARLEGCAGSVRPVESARLASAQAHLARASDAADPELDAAAADAWRALSRPYPVALAQLRRAETLVSGGERDAAVTQLVDVLAAASALGAHWLQAEAEGLATRARLTLPSSAVPPAEAGLDDAMSGGDPFGLTPRERQVIALVANGATNREIGAQLYMAEKTASVHVSRILAKLDVRSRTEAAAVAHRFGLEGSTDR
ncbi:MAG TPA: AAA family ATPase [Solirubrobacteraceae bacterium]|nr:AAA family ATPase [Solirubrobacteraceae bacterium]